MSTVIHPDAGEDVAEARDYLERQVAGLGTDFYEAFLDAVTQIEAAPTRFPVADSARDLRRAHFRRFSYVIEYRIEPSRLHIIVVKHTARDPSFGRGRK